MNSHIPCDLLAYNYNAQTYTALSTHNELSYGESTLDHDDKPCIDLVNLHWTASTLFRPMFPKVCGDQTGEQYRHTL